jgi:hypothetical protein
MTFLAVKEHEQLSKSCTKWPSNVAVTAGSQQQLTLWQSTAVSKIRGCSTLDNWQTTAVDSTSQEWSTAANKFRWHSAPDEGQSTARQNKNKRMKNESIKMTTFASTK